MQKETIVIGKILGTHGIHGELKIAPLTDDASRFDEIDYFLCDSQTYAIASVRYHKGNVLIQTDAVTDRTAAEKMTGKLISVNRKDAVALEEGEYFIEDLKGIKVLDTSSERNGILKDIMQTGAVDILVITIDQKEWMMPYLKEYVSEVNLDKGYMKADLSKGISS